MSLERTFHFGAGTSAARARILALSAAGCLAVATELRAQGGEELDAGTYEVLVNGELVGLERFVVQSDGAAVQAAARVTSSHETAGIVAGEVRLLLDQAYRPDRYELKPSGGDLGSVVGLRRANRLRMQTESEEGERVKEFVAPDDLVILERGFAHHYYLLLGLVREGTGGQQLSLVVPSEGRQFRATVRDEGEESVPVDGQTVTARRYVIEGGGEAHTLWASADGRVLRVEIPTLGWAARRRP